MTDPYAGIATAVGGGDPYAGIAAPSSMELARRNALEQTGKTPGWDRSLQQATTFGFGDEMAGAREATKTFFGNTLDRMQGKTPDYGVSEAYRAQVDAEREAAKRYGQEHPIANAVVGLAGALPGGAAGGATTLGKTMMRGATAGGVMGGLSGAGNSQGGMGERAEGALRGGLTGAAVGAAVPYAVSKGAQGARGVVRAANRATGGKLLSPEKEAARRLAEVLSKDGAVTPKPGLSLMDVAGEETRALTRAAAAKGPARNQAARYADQVAADLQDRTIEATRGLTPDQRPAQAFADDLKRTQGSVSDILYPEFKGDRVPVGDDITSALSGDSGRSALNEALRIADTRRDFDAVQEIQLLMEGGAKSLSAGTLDLIRRGIRDSAGAASRAGSNSIASGLKGREADIENALLDVPGFNTARNIHADYAKQIEAVDTGKKILNIKPEEFAAAISGMTGEGKAAAGVGARQALVDALGAPAEGSTGTLNRLATGTNPGRNLSAVFGDDAASAYRSKLADEISRIENARFIDPRSGSKTASMMMDQEALGAIPKPTLWNIASLALDKLRRGATLTDAERSALLNLSTGDAQAGASAVQPYLVGQQPWLSSLLAPAIGRQAGAAAGQ